MQGSARTAGLALAVFSALGFSFKAIFVKLGLAHGADAVSHDLSLAGATLVIAGVLLVSLRR